MRKVSIRYKDYDQVMQWGKYLAAKGDMDCKPSFASYLKELLDKYFLR
jgi:hypothetical protein